MDQDRWEPDEGYVCAPHIGSRGMLTPPFADEGGATQGAEINALSSKVFLLG